MGSFVSGARLQVICPCGTPAEFIATNNFIAFLQERRYLRKWGGFTYSSTHNPAFVGYFWREKAKKGEPLPPGVLPNPRGGSWEFNSNVLIIIDIPERVVGELASYLTMLHAKISSNYVSVGIPQKSIWMTLETIHIFQP